ncbi:MAG: DUF4147 domain-containing protein [Anaerolineae bacterium]|nr:DUF4147 domain-containing protein [Anaerolineae bacterium]
MFFPDYPSHINQLIQAALDAADPAQAVSTALHCHGDTVIVGEQPYQPQRVFLLAVGKAAGKMAAAATAILADKLYQGILIHKRNHPYPVLPPSIRCFAADHPVPTQDNLMATQAVGEMLAQTTANDLVLVLLSGGASALLTRPCIPLADWQALIQAMLASGCPIDLFNQVRQFFDPVKAGGLIHAAAPAPCAALIMSDVVGNPLEIIGGGPTVTVSQDAAAIRLILNQYQVRPRLSTTTWQQVETILTAVNESGQITTDSRGRIADSTPGFSRFPTFTLYPPLLDTEGTLNHAPVNNYLIADGARVAQAVAQRARQLGFRAQVLTTHWQGEAREAGKIAAALAQDAPAQTCLIMSGETTVTLPHLLADGVRHGVGGRNQETALAAAIQLAGVDGVVLASLATDGEDGPTDAAGAIVTGRTVWQAHQYQLGAREYLARHDSYTFFKRLGDAAAPPLAGRLISTGPTGTNLNDLVIILSYKR